MSIKLKVLTCIIFCFLFAGCMTIKKITIPDEAERLELQPLQAAAGYDVYQLRIDIVRQTTTKTETVTDSKGVTSTKTITENKPYHYLGVYLGNGLFLDANLNLGLDLIRLLHLEDRQNFTLIRKIPNLFQSQVIYKKEGNLITIEYRPAIMGIKQTITLNDKGAKIKGGFLQADQDITENASEIVYDPHGIFGEWSVLRLLKKENGAEIPGFWENMAVVKNADGTVTLPKYMKFEIAGREIVLKLSDIFGIVHKTYRLIMTNDSILFFDEHNWGILIEIYTDGLKVDWGSHQEYYEIKE